MMNADAITARVLHYLRYQRQCPLVWTQRSPWNRGDHRPDVVAITRDRRVIEIEVKLSRSDFAANDGKHCMSHGARPPVWEKCKQFWFAVPMEVAPEVAAIVPDYAGLLGVPESPWDVRVLVRAPSRRNAPRLSARDMVRVARHLSGTIVSLAMSHKGQEAGSET
jgi:hypothetical protein